jgi:hypothetical protein
LENVTAAAPTEKPEEAVTGVIPTWAEAFIVVAPEIKFDAVNVTVASPLISVKAVPLAGDRVPKVGSVTLKVTTVLGTAVAEESSRCPVTVLTPPPAIGLAIEAMDRVGVPDVPPTDNVIRFVA